MIKVNKVENLSGTIQWRMLNGDLHREDGPAIIWDCGAKEWWVDGKLHREDGPASMSPSGKNYWYLNGVRYDPLEWLIELSKI